MLVRKSGKAVCAFGLGLTMTLAGCGKKDKKDDSSDDESTTASPSTTGGGTSSALGSASSVADLKLSGLNIALPEALDAKGGSSLRLLGAKKSADACMLGQSVKEITGRLDNIAGFACHIEVEKEKIQFNKKYKLVVQGQEFGRVMVEKSGDLVTFASCMSGDHTGTDLIKITGLSDAGPAGSIYGTWSDGTHSSVDYLSFDLSAAGVKSMTAKQKFSEGSNLFRRTGEVSLVEGGVSTVKLASSGTWQDNSFAQRGAAKFNADFGASLFQNQGAYNGSEYNWVHRAFFSTNGDTVASDASVDFAQDGALRVSRDDAPEFLTEADEIPAADGWVGGGCADFDEEIELNPDSAEHQACEQNHSDEHANCWGADFENGESSGDL